MSFVWFNGNFVLEETASISLRDTGLLHGAGIFTTMRAFRGRVFRLDGHLRRLRESSEALSIPLPYRDEELRAAVEELLSQNRLAEARLRLTITRGAAETGADGSRLQPAVVLSATETRPYPPELYQRGMTAVVIDDQKLNPYD